MLRKRDQPVSKSILKTCHQCCHATIRHNPSLPPSTVSCIRSHPFDKLKKLSEMTGKLVWTIAEKTLISFKSCKNEGKLLQEISFHNIHTVFQQSIFGRLSFICSAFHICLFSIFPDELSVL